MSRQALGQHFLNSGKALDRIARAAAAGERSLAVEIGPGRGALTRYLLEHFERVVAIEIDPELVAHLRAVFGAEPRLEIVEGNALEASWPAWGSGVLAGNLPYYAATPIISRYLRNPGLLSPSVFLIQKEVAERITAEPGTRDYGFLSVECQLLANTEYLFAVPPGAFRPPPRVESAVIRLTPRPVPANPDVDAFLEFASACFRQKRKTLRNNLLGRFDRALLDSRPEMARRAEQLSVDEFIDLYRGLGAPGAI